MDKIIRKPLGFFIVSTILLVLCGIFDYGLFHFLVDIFTIFIGFMIFIIAINSRLYTEKLIYLVLAVSYLYISCLDLMHLIAFSDISLLGQSFNHSYQYFASARIFESVVLVLIFTFIRNPKRVNYRFAHLFGVCVVIVTLIVVQLNWLSPFFIEGQGQTTIKLLTSYLTALLFVTSSFMAYKTSLPPRKKNVLVVVFLLKAFAQIVHGSFVTIGDWYQITAMLLRFLSYGGLYLIFVQEIVAGPYKNVYSLFESKEKELLSLSERDGLTGIFNHSLTFKNIEKLIEKIGNSYSNLCVIMFDIDNFKQINDSFGHIKGDEMLKLFTNSIVELDFKDQMLGRYGGDEFVLAIPDCHSPDIDVLFTRLNKRLSKIAKEHGVHVTFSAGVVLWHIGDNATDLIRKADIKMYESKDKGKNQYSVWEHELNN